MKVLELSRYALCISTAIAMLAGCGSQAPIGAPGAMAQSPAIATHADRSGSWMAPDAQAQDLLYVSNVHNVTVYSYPKGDLIGKLKGFYVTGGECVDAAQDVWITDLGHNRLVEYAHGGQTPIRILTGIGGAGCAVDPATGNLAVTTLGGTVYVYKNARGKPLSYTDSDISRFYYCSYDNNGNFFADCATSANSYSFELARLSKGSSTLKTMSVDQYISFAGGVEWDGKHLAVGDGQVPVIYEFAIKGSRGTKVGTTRLGPNAKFVFQFFIDNGIVIAPNECGSSCSSDLLFYKYPAGGSAIKKITKGIFYPHGAIVSKGQAEESPSK
jgi:hypothetical protein